MSEENGEAVGAETIRESVCISADPETHVKFARRYIDLGFDHLIFHSAGPDQREFLEAYRRTFCRGSGRINGEPPPRRRFGIVIATKRQRSDLHF